MRIVSPQRVLLLMALGRVIAGCSSAPESAQAVAKQRAAMPCRDSVAAFLGQGGLRLDQLQAIRVRPEMLAGGEQVAYWQLAARPATCADGRLDLTILPDCSIAGWRTEGGCRVPGLDPAG
jgi:hypothetical protein